jgi:hypothetical protein
MLTHLGLAELTAKHTGAIDMKKILIVLSLVASFSASAQVPIVIAQDPSARVTVLGIDSKTHYLIDTGLQDKLY